LAIPFGEKLMIERIEKRYKSAAICIVFLWAPE